MRVALIQLVSGHDVAANLETITSTARAAAGDGARLLVYPEAAMFAFVVAAFVAVVSSRPRRNPWPAPSKMWYS